MLLVAAGFLGGFTTMGAFGAETVSFLQESRYGLAALTVLLNPVVSVVAAAAGALLDRSL
ncbi:MAG TPA: CrcB family protein [Candidatus Thermoplasmatota archaeon]|nr:CrcB family protein [Candidatus Thermoplasmatota archaeon]